MEEMPSNQVAKPSEQQECQNPVNRAQLSGSSLTQNLSAVARFPIGPFRASLMGDQDLLRSASPHQVSGSLNDLCHGGGAYLVLVVLIVAFPRPTEGALHEQ